MVLSWRNQSVRVFLLVRILEVRYAWSMMACHGLLLVS